MKVKESSPARDGWDLLPFENPFDHPVKQDACYPLRPAQNPKGFNAYMPARNPNGFNVRCRWLRQTPGNPKGFNVHSSGCNPETPDDAVPNHGVVEESQRDSDPKPRVAPQALPWDLTKKSFQPQRGCGRRRYANSQNNFGPSPPSLLQDILSPEGTPENSPAASAPGNECK
jgi:hypothetical protein